MSDYKDLHFFFERRQLIAISNLSAPGLIFQTALSSSAPTLSGFPAELSSLSTLVRHTP